MGFRFRKSVKIAPGVRLTVGKKSASVRLGPRGVGFSASTTGRKTVSAGIPGTGVSFVETVGSKKRGRRPPKTAIPVIDDDVRLLRDDPRLLPPEQEKKRSRVGIILLLIAIGFGVYWCSGTSNNAKLASTPSLQGEVSGTTDRPSSSAVTQTAVPNQTGQAGQGAPTAAPQTPIVMYTSAAVRLREGPSTSSDIITTVPIHTRINSLATEGEWHNVLAGLQKGWIHGEYLSEQSPPPAAAPQTNIAPIAKIPPRSQESRPTRSSNSRYMRGPRGGCYYLNRNGNKIYVDRSMC